MSIPGFTASQDGKGPSYQPSPPLGTAAKLRPAGICHTIHGKAGGSEIFGVLAKDTESTSIFFSFFLQSHLFFLGTNGGQTQGSPMGLSKSKSTN